MRQSRFVQDAVIWGVGPGLRLRSIPQVMRFALCPLAATVGAFGATQFAASFPIALFVDGPL